MSCAVVIKDAPQRWQSLEDKERSGRPTEGDSDQFRASLTLISYNYTRSCWRSPCQPVRGHSTFEANWKDEKAQYVATSWADQKLKKNHHFEVSSSLILCNNNKPFLNWIVNVWQKWIVYDNQRRPTQGLDWEDAPKRFPESALYQGKVTVTLVVCRQSDPPQLSESQRNHCSWEVCSANQWDTPKTSTPAAGIGQQKGSDSSPRQCLTTRCTTSASEVGQIGLRSSAPSAVFAWPLTNKLPLLQASRQLFAGKTFLQPGCRKMLSKSSSNSEAQIFTL